MANGYRKAARIRRLAHTALTAGVTVLLLLVLLTAVLFVIARGTPGDAPERLCATMLEKNFPLTGIFFTTGEINTAGAYSAPLPATENIAGVRENIPEADASGIRLSGAGWTGILTESSASYPVITLSAEASAKPEISLGLDGYVDAVMTDGLLVYAGSGDDTLYCVVTADENGVLSAGAMTAYDIATSGCAWAISADRVLVNGGVPASDLGGGYAARAAIGQTADGRILLFAASSGWYYPCGITYDELASVMYRYGAVTAAALRPAGSLQTASGETVKTAGGADYMLCIGGEGAEQ